MKENSKNRYSKNYVKKYVTRQVILKLITVKPVYNEHS